LPEKIVAPGILPQKPKLPIRYTSALIDRVFKMKAMRADIKCEVVRLMIKEGVALVVNQISTDEE
jgi:hypothetical protein